MNGADSLLKLLLSFEFVVSAITCRHVLAYTRLLKLLFRQRTVICNKAHRNVQRLVKALETEGTTIHYGKQLPPSPDFDIEPAKRTSEATELHQFYCCRSEDHYSVCYYFASSVSHLKAQFSSELAVMLLATYFLPANIDYFNHQSQVSSSPIKLESEVSMWKIHVAEIDGWQMRFSLFK